MSKIYLPRIREILRDRNADIDKNSLAAAELQKEIDEINNNAQSLKDQSIAQYSIALDQSVKQSSIMREEALNNAKKKIGKMVEDSKEQMEKFIQDSEAASKEVSQKIIETTVNKLFDKKITGQEALSLINKQ